MHTLAALILALSCFAPAPSRTQQPAPEHVGTAIETTLKTLDTAPERFRGEVAVGPVRVRAIEQAEAYDGVPSRTFFVITQKDAPDVVGDGQPIFVFSSSSALIESVERHRAVGTTARAYLEIVKRTRAKDGTMYFEAKLTRLEWLGASGEVVETAE